MTDPKIKIVCAECGSENVMRDAYACWNVERQEWELQCVFDQGYCDKCAETGDSEARLEEVVI